MICLLAEAAPALLLAADSHGRTPLHVAAAKAKEEAMRQLLSLRPKAAAAPDSSQRTPLHAAAATPCWGCSSAATAMRLLVDAAPAACRIWDSSGATPLELLLSYAGGAAAARELGAGDPPATQELLRGAQRPANPSLPPRIAACLPLCDIEWASLPVHCLPPALPAALAHSPAQVRLLVAALPPEGAARLHALALCLAQRSAATSFPCQRPSCSACSSLPVACCTPS